MSFALRLAAPAAVLFASLSIAQAFPQDGQFYQGFTCPSEGFEPGTESTACTIVGARCVIVIRSRSMVATTSSGLKS